MFPVEEVLKAWEAAAEDDTLFGKRLQGIAAKIEKCVVPMDADLEVWSTAVAATCTKVCERETAWYSPRDEAMELAWAYARRLARAWDQARGAPVQESPSHPVVDFLHKLGPDIMVTCDTCDDTTALFELGVQCMKKVPIVGGKVPSCMSMHVSHMCDVISTKRVMYLRPMDPLQVVCTALKNGLLEESEGPVSVPALLDYGGTMLYTWEETVRCLNLVREVLTSSSMAPGEAFLTMLMNRSPWDEDGLRALAPDVVQVLGDYAAACVAPRCQRFRHELDHSQTLFMTRALQFSVPCLGAPKSAWVHTAAWVLACSGPIQPSLMWVLDALMSFTAEAVVEIPHGRVQISRSLLVNAPFWARDRISAWMAGEEVWVVEAQAPTAEPPFVDVKS
jgi:hypothetical protein